ncbi:hypothetical protein ACFQNE_15180 [Gordonia phosphorivorans]|uniref:PE family protein n=1 Tax=Gordonia phosphorivorans TaxID=1056982 RepID=A0ABV6HBQ6_9ACTN
MADRSPSLSSRVTTQPSAAATATVRASAIVARTGIDASPLAAAADVLSAAGAAAAAPPGVAANAWSAAGSSGGAAESASCAS